MLLGVRLPARPPPHHTVLRPQRRCVKTRARLSKIDFMTSTDLLGDLLSALKHSANHIWRLDHASPLQKLWLMYLKSWAVTGYHMGRRKSMQERARGSRQAACTADVAPETDVTVERAAQVAEGGSSREGRGPAPRVAVIIPCLLRRTADLVRLRAAIRALLASTLRPVLVCIVDDGSPVMHLADDDELAAGPEVMVLRLGVNRGPAQARNAGLAACRAHGVEMVCFTDADCLPSATWLEEMAAAQARRPGIVCGRTLAVLPRSFIGVYHDVFGTLNGRRLQDGSLLYGCTCNLSLDAAIVPLAFTSSFPEAAFEDVEFCVRARKRDIALSYSEAAVVRHAYDETPQGLYSQFWRYGRWEQHMCKLHPEYLSWLWSSTDIPSRLDFAST